MDLNHARIRPIVYFDDNVKDLKPSEFQKKLKDISQQLKNENAGFNRQDYFNKTGILLREGKESTVNRRFSRWVERVQFWWNKMLSKFQVTSLDDIQDAENEVIKDWNKNFEALYKDAGGGESEDSTHNTFKRLGGDPLTIKAYYYPPLDNDTIPAALKGKARLILDDENRFGASSCWLKIEPNSYVKFESDDFLYDALGPALRIIIDKANEANVKEIKYPLKSSDLNINNKKEPTEYKFEGNTKDLLEHHFIAKPVEHASEGAIELASLINLANGVGIPERTQEVLEHFFQNEEPEKLPQLLNELELVLPVEDAKKCLEAANVSIELDSYINRFEQATTQNEGDIPQPIQLENSLNHTYTFTTDGKTITYLMDKTVEDLNNIPYPNGMLLVDTNANDAGEKVLDIKRIDGFDRHNLKDVFSTIFSDNTETLVYPLSSKEDLSHFSKDPIDQISYVTPEIRPLLAHGFKAVTLQKDDTEAETLAEFLNNNRSQQLDSDGFKKELNERVGQYGEVFDRIRLELPKGSMKAFIANFSKKDILDQIQSSKKEEFIAMYKELGGKNPTVKRKKYQFYNTLKEDRDKKYEVTVYPKLEGNHLPSGMNGMEFITLNEVGKSELEYNLVIRSRSKGKAAVYRGSTGSKSFHSEARFYTMLNLALKQTLLNRAETFTVPLLSGYLADNESMIRRLGAVGFKARALNSSSAPIKKLVKLANEKPQDSIEIRKCLESILDNDDLKAELVNVKFNLTKNQLKNCQSLCQLEINKELWQEIDNPSVLEKEYKSLNGTWKKSWTANLTTKSWEGEKQENQYQVKKVSATDKSPYPNQTIYFATKAGGKSEYYSRLTVSTNPKEKFAEIQTQYGFQSAPGHLVPEVAKDLKKLNIKTLTVPVNSHNRWELQKDTQKNKPRGDIEVLLTELGALSTPKQGFEKDKDAVQLAKLINQGFSSSEAVQGKKQSDDSAYQKELAKALGEKQENLSKLQVILDLTEAKFTK